MISPRTQRSSPVPSCFDSGTYPVHPAAAAPPFARNPDRMVSPPTGSSQNDSALILGNAMSSAPICRVRSSSRTRSASGR